MSQPQPTTLPSDPPATEAGSTSALAAAQAELAALKSTLAATERRHALDRALATAGAIDPESAAILAARLPNASTAEPAALAAELRRTKPFLFGAMRTTATAAPIAPDPAPLDAAASHARTTGDRRSLLHYLRLRRQPPA